MCGRIDGDFDALDFTRLFGLSLPDAWPGAHAVAPTMSYPIVRLPPGGRVEAALARWGLVPLLYRGLLRQFRHATFNARAEDVERRPSFVLAWRQARRCLVMTRGFHEWNGEKGRRQAHLVTRADGRPLVLGGLWETWHGEFGPLDTFTLLTCPAGPDVAALHDRMPVVLDRDAWRAWLDPRTPPAELARLVRPAPAGRLQVVTVTDEATRPRHKRPVDAA